MTAELLLLFLRHPERGRVKTRLGATIGEERALEVYERLLGHTLDTASAIPFDKQACFADGLGKGGAWEEAGFKVFAQHGGDLGTRMSHSFSRAFADGYQQVVIIGTDCPGITTDLLSEAFKLITTHDVVIGPADDGGYYLLGMRGPFLKLFDGIRWSTDSVAKDTERVCRENNLSYSMLRPLGDIDEEKDLHLLDLLP
ncbi:MAG: TIGR04282 family arsenosugar biosynthesis glycosyltransferase [Bacteroidota bacterium]|nr:TIGR04282 family arsenosugar biosynthesis glycosyltransferase [Bacteroidota bacterium]